MRRPAASRWNSPARIRSRWTSTWQSLGLRTSPVAGCLMGYASGYASYCLGKSVYFVERECRAKGDKRCLAMGMDVDSWGQEIAERLALLPCRRHPGQDPGADHAVAREGIGTGSPAKATGTCPAGSQIASVEVRSREFQRVVELAERVAKFDSSVLITGETGVGKEIVARHIHSHSPRSEALFVAVNCGALPESLLESTLFGHKAGAFTGATKDQPGLFEEAEKGTIFLDEIGDTTPAMQLKLLRVLQEREIMRVGETRPRKVDVRVISATNRDLQQAVHDNSFREDLYYRLRVVEIEVPPLRRRKDDILPLARHFVKKCAAHLGLPALRLDATSLDCLLEYPWPGNVRELENAVEHAAVFCQDNVILPKHFPSRILGKRDFVGRRAERDRLDQTLPRGCGMGPYPACPVGGRWEPCGSGEDPWHRRGHALSASARVPARAGALTPSLPHVSATVVEPVATLRVEHESLSQPAAPAVRRSACPLPGLRTDRRPPPRGSSPRSAAASRCLYP